MAPMHCRDFFFPSCSDVGVVHFALPIGLVGDVIHEEQHALLANRHYVVIPVHNGRKVLCVTILIATPVIVRKAESGQLQYLVNCFIDVDSCIL